MKNIIFLVTLLLVLSSCEKTTHLDSPNFDSSSHEQPNEVHTNLKPVFSYDLPEIGDQLYTMHRVNGIKIYGTSVIVDVQEFGISFTILAKYNNKIYSIFADKKIIYVKVPNCNSSKPATNFATYKAEVDLTHSNPLLQGIYNFNMNDGCSGEGINDITDPSCAGQYYGTCPFVDPKIVVFHNDNDGVLLINWL